MPNLRQLNLLIFLATLAIMGVALFMQHVMDLVPCYLCIVQRVFVVVTGCIALLAYIHNPGNTGIRVYGAATAISALAGGGFSIRQLWLQSLPEDEIPACGPGLSYIVENLEYFPMQEVLTMMLTGTGDCADVQWVFLGLSIPGWTLFVFVSMIVLGLFQLLRRR